MGRREFPNAWCLEQCSTNRHSCSPYTSLENIKRVIKVLDVRLTNLFDLPSEAAYFFAEPDLTTEEAKSMVKTVPPAMQGALAAGALLLHRLKTDH